MIDTRQNAVITDEAYKELRDSVAELLAGLERFPAEVRDFQAGSVYGFIKGIETTAALKRQTA